MPAFAKSSFNGVPCEAMQTLFFQRTSADHAGGAIGENGHVHSFTKLREKKPLGAVQAAQRSLSAPSLSSDGRSSDRLDLVGITTKETEHNAKPLGGFEVDRGLAESFRPRPQDPTVKLKPEQTSYSRFYAPGRKAGETALIRPPNNKVGTVIYPGGAQDKATCYREKHNSPPKELVVPVQRMPYPGCPYWLGAGSSASCFNQSRYALEFGGSPAPSSIGRASSLASSPKKRPVAAPASTPPSSHSQSESATDDLDLMMRSFTMRSQYGRAHGGKPSTRHPFPGAAEMRNTITGR